MPDIELEEPVKRPGKWLKNGGIFYNENHPRATLHCEKTQGIHTV